MSEDAAPNRHRQGRGALKNGLQRALMGGAVMTPALLVHQSVVIGIVTGVAAALIAGVVLPAVWSTRRSRRLAALEVMDRLLGREQPQRTNRKA